MNPIGLPQVAQKFRNLDDAWSFWVNYGGRAGFEIRKRYKNESKYDGKVTSCRYVCAKVGRRAQDKRDHLMKNPRAETRTCCPVRMGLTLDRGTGNYELVDLMLVHNHGLYLQQTFHLMSSQRIFRKCKLLKLRLLMILELGQSCTRVCLSPSRRSNESQLYSS